LDWFSFLTHLHCPSNRGNLKTDVLSAAVKRSGHVKVVASVKVVNSGKTEERDIVYIFEVERRLDF
jgi:hypothetical protein